MFKIEFDLEVGFDACQVAAHVGCFLARLKLTAPAILHLFKIFIDGVQCAKLVEQGNCGLFAHTLHAGDVIRGITDDGFVVHDLIGMHTQFFDHVRIGDVGLVITREIDRRAFIDQLQQIPVASDDLHAQTLFSSDLCHRAEHIIGFVTVHFEARNVEHVHHLTDALDLRTQVIGHFFARPFVLREDVITEGFAYIKSHSEVFGLFLLHHADELARKTVNASCRLALRIYPTL